MGGAALIVAGALALAGCSAAGDDEPQHAAEVKEADYNPQPRENLQQGGEVRFAIGNIPPQMNDANSDATASSATLAAWFRPQVLLMEPDGTPYKNDAYLDVWEHHEVDGNTQLTFTFTDEAHWNDGTDMDWTAIESTWKTQRSYDEGFNPNAIDGYQGIKSVEQGETPKTAIVTYDGLFAWPEMPFATLVHPKAATPEEFNEGFVENPRPELGAGPYAIETFDVQAGLVVLEPNSEWWGAEPLLDKVTFRQLESTAAINAFKNGEIDGVGTPSQDELSQVADVEDTVTYRAQQTANTLLQVNAERPQFADLEVRKAFFLGINRDQQKQIAWQGLGYDEPDAGSFILYSFQPDYSDSLAAAGWAHDPDEANSILDGAGWEAGEDGIRTKDGVRFSGVLPIWGDSSTQASLGQGLQASLKEIGFDLEVDVRPAQAFSDDITSKNWDISSLRFTSSDPFGAAWFCQLYCSDSGLNLSSTGTDEIDERIAEEVAAKTTAEEQTQAAMQLEPEIMAETWGIIPLYNGPSISTVKQGLANLSPEPYVGLDLFGVSPVENVGWEKSN